MDAHPLKIQQRGRLKPWPSVARYGMSNKSREIPGDPSCFSLTHVTKAHINLAAISKEVGTPGPGLE